MHVAANGTPRTLWHRKQSNLFTHLGGQLATYILDHYQNLITRANRQLIYLITIKNLIIRANRQLIYLITIKNLITGANWQLIYT